MIHSILGPLFVADDGEQVTIAAPGPRAALALLLLQNSRPLSVDGFVDGLWGQDPPKTARAQVHTIVRRLRQALPPHVQPLLNSRPCSRRTRTGRASPPASRWRCTGRADRPTRWPSSARCAAAWPMTWAST